MVLTNMNTKLAPNAKWMHENTADIKIKAISGHLNSVNNCQFVDNDTKLFTASNDLTARIWDSETGKELRNYAELHASYITMAKMSDNDQKFVTGSLDKTVKCWDVETGKLLWKNRHNNFITSCEFSNEDSKYVVSVSDFDFLIKIWDTHSGKLIDSIADVHQNSVTSCKFSPKNDRLMTTSMDRTCKFYDLLSKNVTLKLNGHDNIITSCCMSPDERTFATTSWDKTIKIWDIATGMYRMNGPISLNKGHEGSISCCRLNKNGNYCVSGGYDLKVILWDVVMAKVKLVLRGHSNWITDVDISKDNKWVMSVSKDSQIRLWYIADCENMYMPGDFSRPYAHKVVHCKKCSRPFSLSKLDRSPLTLLDDPSIFDQFCVFCRYDVQKKDHKNVYLDDNIN